jgi:predicted lysophospholipase L1 biosynthesis ABC-type transport system permease subunit
VRAAEVEGRSVPMFGTTPLKGDVDFVVLDGRAPSAADEVAIAPATMDELGLHVGDEIGIGPGSATSARVVGRVLLPLTSHTGYDQSAWMTAAGLARALPPDFDRSGDFGEGYVFVRWRGRTDGAEQVERLTALGAQHIAPPALPDAVEGLGNVRALPVALAVFFALVAVATVAHALWTTVRRREYDLAILRSMGLTRRDSRLAIVWQATLLAIVGLVLGVPLGILVGRLVWRQIAESFPVVYVPPLALFAVLLVVPGALVIANLLAAGPARAASRLRPAECLRSE